MKVESIVPHKPFRFSDVQLAQLRAIFKDSPQTRRFLADLQRIVGDHVELKEEGSVFPSIDAVRSHAREIQKGARAIAMRISELHAGEKELLGQLMWLADRKYYPAAFSVDNQAEGLRVLEIAAAEMARRHKGGRVRLQIDVLIRDMNSAYVKRFNRHPKITAAKADDFMAALRACLKAAAEPLPANLLSSVRQALGL